MKKFFFLIAVQCFALSTSHPVVVSEIPEFSSSPKVRINDQGIAAIYWVNDFAYCAIKNDQWGEPQRIAFEPDWIDCVIDPVGNLTVFWTGCYGDGCFDHLVEKKVDELWGEPNKLTHGSNIYRTFSNGKLFSCEKTGSDTHLYSFDKASKHLIGNLDSFDRRDIISASSPEGKRMVFWENSFENNMYHFVIAWEKEDGSWTEPEDIFIRDWQLEFGVDDVKVVVDSKENIYITCICEDNDYNESLWAIIRQDGQWLKPEIVINGTDDFGRYEAAVDAEGNLMVVWTYDDFDAYSGQLYGAYKPFGEDWKRSMELTTAKELNASPVLKANKKGGFVLVWQQSTSWFATTIQGMTFSTYKKVWSDPVQLSSKGEMSGNPSFDLTSEGIGIVSWITLRSPFRIYIEAATLSL